MSYTEEADGIFSMETSPLWVFPVPLRFCAKILPKASILHLSLYFNIELLKSAFTFNLEERFSTVIVICLYNKCCQIFS